MITVIHGDNTAISRKFLQSIKDEKKPLTLSQQEINLTDLAQVFESESLFFEQKTVILEDYLGKTRKSKEKDAVLTYLSTQGHDHDIFFWDAKPLTKASYSGLKNVVERPFKLPQTVFQFLDAIRPDNRSTLIKLYHETLQTTEPELLLYMIIRHFRVLLATSENAKIDELKNKAPWQQEKYKKQAGLFGIKNLRVHYHNLFEIEKKQKTGELSADLSATIDFFLLSL